MNEISKKRPVQFAHFTVFLNWSVLKLFFCRLRAWITFSCFYERKKFAWEIGLYSPCGYDTYKLSGSLADGPPFGGEEGAYMQIHVSHVPEAQENALGAPLLLYTGKLNEQELAHPRIAHAHPDIVEFIYILKGHGEYEIAGKRYPVKQSDLIVYNRGVVHNEFVKEQRLPILFCAATGIQRPKLESNCVLDRDVSPVFHIGEDQKAVQYLMQKMFDTASLGDAYSMTMCQALFAAFLYLVVEIVDQNSSEQNGEKVSANRLGQEIRAYVDTMPIKDVSVPLIAEKFGISESYLARVFKKSFGYPLVEYLMHRKIGEAQTLLLSTHLSVMEIAECVGYQNHSYFSKMFAEYVGLSPLRYRKMYQGQQRRRGKFSQ